MIVHPLPEGDRELLGSNFTDVQGH
jgi:hypothetical protein